MAQTYTIESFQKYIELISEIKRNELYLFRGQINDEPLLPKIARKNHLIDTCNDEIKMLNEFIRRSGNLIDNISKSKWDLLGIAQHHGLKTRLLDWTSNPLVALWFACIGYQIKNDYSVVWCLLVDDNMLQIKNENPFNYGSTKVFNPKIVHRRIESQSGWFTVHKYSNKANSFVPLEVNKLYQKYLTKFKIPKSLRNEILKTLNTCGINSSSIFPDLGGLCQHINWSYPQ